VGILFKDDNLGLGAKRKGGGRDIEAQRTGLDAFQGLLGRLNGKGEGELKELEKKVEERKLEMFFMGRWGGMVFVRGGILVGTVGDKNKEGEEKKEDEERADTYEAEVVSQAQVLDEDEERRERRRLREEKRLRKEERRKRKEEKALKEAARAKSKSREKASSDSDSPSETPATLPPKHKSPISQPPDEPVSSAPSDNEAEKSRLKAENKRKRKSAVSLVQSESEPSRSSSPSVTVLKNGRHLLRGRNIQAKRMVLADAKGLDQIFMR
jgi:Pin2-interacting protein X1